MATTSKGFRYPASSAAPNVPQDIQNLATDLDNYFSPTPQAITLASGWTNLAGGFQAIQGVHLGGLVVLAGTIVYNASYSTQVTVVAANGIPSALLPAHSVMVHGAVQSGTGTGIMSSRFDVSPTGSITVYAPNGVTVAANAYHTFTAVYTTNNL